MGDGGMFLVPVVTVPECLAQPAIGVCWERGSLAVKTECPLSRSSLVANLPSQDKGQGPTKPFVLSATVGG